MTAAERQGIDEDDVALIDALHINPRASFEQLGATLDLSSATVGRRWRRLTRSGAAWVSSAPGPAMPLAGAVVDVTCAPGQVTEVARTLAENPRVASIHLTSGTWDLFALVVAQDIANLSALLVDDLAPTPGVHSTRARPVMELFSGAHWRLGAIGPNAAHELSAGNPEHHSQTAVREPDAFDKALYQALQVDGRMSLRDLAQRLGRSESTVKRRLDHLTRTGMLTFRTDFIRFAGGWHLYVALSLRVPDELLYEAGRDIGRWPETRVCAAVAGAANLFVTAQLHDLRALEPLLRRIRAARPGIEIDDRQIVLRSVKSWGRLLGPDGRAVDVVPVSPWT
ncbi:Lrp/AsnC family transcriptional regulator [Streptomyces sp. NPDC002677]|uniref:Lrp/AsnC family transcriptional regulator n=1 Tax=Streptomyces sp. NPDC002677 TaxID=3154774 RepID=UPI003325843F